MLYVVGQHLLSEIGSGIDYDNSTTILYQYGATKAFVVRIIGVANLTWTCDYRHTLRGSGS